MMKPVINVMMRPVIIDALIILKHNLLYSPVRPWNFSHSTSASQVTARASLRFNTCNPRTSMTDMCPQIQLDMDSSGPRKPWLSGKQFKLTQCLGSMKRHLRLRLAWLTAFAPETWGGKNSFSKPGLNSLFQEWVSFSLSRNRGKCMLCNQRGCRAGTPKRGPQLPVRRKLANGVLVSLLS